MISDFLFLHWNKTKPLKLKYLKKTLKLFQELRFQARVKCDIQKCRRCFALLQSVPGVSLPHLLLVLQTHPVDEAASRGWIFASFASDAYFVVSWRHTCYAEWPACKWTDHSDWPQCWPVVRLIVSINYRYAQDPRQIACYCERAGIDPGQTSGLLRYGKWILRLWHKRPRGRPAAGTPLPNGKNR